MQKFNPERFQDSVLEIIGQREYDRMKEKSLKIVKYNMKDLEEVFEFLTEKLRELEADYGRV
jgi:predicted component of type VI protein secretion system